MDTHKNAPLTPKGREAMVRSVVEGRLSKAAAARQFNVTPKTVAKWIKRFRAEGVDGLRDRSSRPHSLPSQTPVATCAAVEALRRQRYTGKQIAAEVGVSPATVSRILRRLGLNRLAALEPAEPGENAVTVTVGPADDPAATVAAIIAVIWPGGGAPPPARLGGDREAEA
jgi:transposase